jgi:quercetin dioxygenase-like cupin family protein
MIGGSGSHPSREPFVVMGVSAYRRIRGSETAGTYSVMEHVFPPGTGPAFLHAHPAQESIGVIEGRFEIYSNGSHGKIAKKAGPGDIHHIASNGAHGLKNVGNGIGRTFAIFHPADIQERFFEEFSDLLASTSGSPEPAIRDALFAKHGMVAIEARYAAPASASRG